MSEFTSDSPQISASPLELDFVPYTSGPYNAQWSAPELLHDKNMLCSSRMIEKTKSGTWRYVAGVRRPWGRQVGCYCPKPSLTNPDPTRA